MSLGLTVGWRASVTQGWHDWGGGGLWSVMVAWRASKTLRTKCRGPDTHCAMWVEGQALMPGGSEDLEVIVLH